MVAAMERPFDPLKKEEVEEANSAALNKRMLTLQEARRKMYPETVEATAFWDVEVERLSDSLAEVENRVLFAHQDVEERRGDSPRDAAERALFLADRKIAFGNQDDDIGREYQKIVDDIEKYLRAKLHGGKK